MQGVETTIACGLGRTMRHCYTLQGIPNAARLEVYQNSLTAHRAICNSHGVVATVAA